MATVRYFWQGFIHRGTAFMYLQSSRSLIYHFFRNVCKAPYTISASIFVYVPYWPPYSTDKFNSCVVPGPSQWFFLLWRKDRNRMDSYRVSTADVPEASIASGARGPWQQQQCDTLHCHEEWWGSVPPSVFSPESMRLRSLRQSEITTVRDPVQYKRWTQPCYRAVNTEHQQRWTHWWCTTPSQHLENGDCIEGIA